MGARLEEGVAPVIAASIAAGLAVLRQDLAGLAKAH